MENVKCIFFDIGYTLINEDDVWEQRCLEQSEMEEAKNLNLSANRIYDEIIQASLAYKPQYRTVVNKFKFKEVAPYRYEFEKLYEEANLILKQLSCKYKLGIIANQGKGLRERLEKLGILRYFSVVISSWDYKLMKPDTKLFEIAIEESGYDASEIVMIGDRLDNDIFPAKQARMQTIWIKQGFGGMQKPITEEHIPDIEISKLSDLIELFDINIGKKESGNYIL